MALIPNVRDEFAHGFTFITSKTDAVGIDFGILRLGADVSLCERTFGEVSWVLLNGSAVFRWNEKSVRVSRASLFDEAPTALHVSTGTDVTIETETECEFAVVGADNSKRFEPRLFLPEEISPEYRGRGLVQDACLRNVRAIFDKTNRPESNLVLGEVVNFPGRWSSYPPHHHAQPEIYHYRFTLPQGYGHGEVGDDVYKIRHGDTTIIAGGRDHAQVSAPGYGMYYLWIVRHLENNPYLGFEFTEEHRWILNPENQGWVP